MVNKTNSVPANNLTTRIKQNTASQQRRRRKEEEGFSLGEEYAGDLKKDGQDGKKTAKDAVALRARNRTNGANSSEAGIKDSKEGEETGMVEGMYNYPGMLLHIKI